MPDLTDAQVSLIAAFIAGAPVTVVTETFKRWWNVQRLIIKWTILTAVSLITILIGYIAVTPEGVRLVPFVAEMLPDVIVAGSVWYVVIGKKVFSKVFDTMLQRWQNGKLYEKQQTQYMQQVTQPEAPADPFLAQ